MKTIRIKLSNGEFIQKVIWGGKKLQKRMNVFRNEAMKNRTKAELWAEKLLLQSFYKEEFHVEFVYNFRRFDFYFPQIRQAIEIDGDYHLDERQRLYDEAVDAILFKEHRISVHRVRNFDKNRLDKVIEKIKILNAPIRLKNNLRKSTIRAFSKKWWNEPGSSEIRASNRSKKLKKRQQQREHTRLCQELADKKQSEKKDSIKISTILRKKGALVHK